MTKLMVKMMDLDVIVPYEKNAKKHPAGQVQDIARSISEYGFNVPILVDAANKIIAGHGRYLAARKLNLKSVPVSVLDGLSDEQVRKFRLADNKVAESQWNNTLLAEELQEIKTTGYGVQDIPGFTESDVDELLRDLTKKIIFQEKKLHKPIKKIHILLSIKTEEYHEIASIIEKLSLNKNLEIIQNGN